MTAVDLLHAREAALAPPATNGRAHASPARNGASGRAGTGAATGAKAGTVAQQAPPAQQRPVAAIPDLPALGAFALPMYSLTRVLTLQTERHVQFVDITDHVTRCVAESGVRDGFAVVFSRHTTAGIRINEHEPLLLEDMARLLDRIVPQDDVYRHDDFSVRTVNLTENERVNGHSHCRSLLLGASETVPVAGGQMLFGRWQRVFLVELDGPARREFVVQVVGG